MHKPLSVEFCLPLLRGEPESGNERRLWWLWVGRCHVCTKKIRMLEGIFCTNFGQSAYGRPPCRHSWCTRCYCESPLIHFPAFRAKGSNNQELDLNETEQMQYKMARPGNGLMCLFKCNFYEFHKLDHWPQIPHKTGTIISWS